jgi:3-oxoacyl-[acyl-carrier-protein] synthase II
MPTTSPRPARTAEAAALRMVLGDRSGSVPTPGSSIKGVTGHSLGAGTTDVDEALDLDVVTAERTWTPGPVLSNSFGFGGHNATLLLTPAG